MDAHPPAGASGGSAQRLRLPRDGRIRRAAEIRGLFRRGKRRRTDHLDVFFAPSPASRSRWGIVVPKHKHTIVERNRLKRRLRELGRTLVLPALRERELALDVMVRARREAYDASFAQLERELAGVTEALCGRSSSG